MRPRLLTGLLTGLLATGLLLLGSPAAAAPVTETRTVKNLVETFVDVVPMCEEGGPLFTITTTSNAIEHVTEFDDGRVHATFTQTGRFVAVPLDRSLPTFRGRFTIWGGFNANGRAVSGTFTFSVRGTGTDGSRVNTHLTDHFNATPTGAEFFFTHCHD